jgi:CRP-like cAMP-binding protein
MSESSNTPSYKNTLLASLAPLVIEGLNPHLIPLDLPKGKILHNSGQLIENVYFLEDGVCSIVATMENGTTVEAGIIGREGFVGVPVVLGTCQSLNQTFIQIPGYGYQIGANVLTEQFKAFESIRSSLLSAVQGLLVQSAQTSACNRVHELPERLARWLLMCLDRVQVNRVLITQEFLATMLGTRRSTVTVAAGILQKAGILEYNRGHVTIMNRDGLEEASCECYRVVHNEYVRLGLL